MPSSSNHLGIEFLLFTLSRYFGKQDTILPSFAPCSGVSVIDFEQVIVC